jgi:methyl-accepting chemotaxis protein
MEQIMTLEIVNEQKLVNMKWRFDQLQPEKQYDLKLKTIPKPFSDLAPSITTQHTIKHEFNVVKPYIVKRITIPRTTSIFSIFKDKVINSKMFLSSNRYVDFKLFSKNISFTIEPNHYMTFKPKIVNPSPVSYIDMPYVYKKTGNKTRIILREKHEYLAECARIRQAKLDHLRDLDQKLKKQKKRATNELNKFNPKVFAETKTKLNHMMTQANKTMKKADKIFEKANLKQERINEIVDNKIDKLEQIHNRKMQQVYDWQDRLAYKQQKLDDKFEQANYLYGQANKIVKKNKAQIQEEIERLGDMHKTVWRPEDEAKNRSY